jgi:hypothetical protein
MIGFRYIRFRYPWQGDNASLKPDIAARLKLSAAVSGRDPLSMQRSRPKNRMIERGGPMTNMTKKMVWIVALVLASVVALCGQDLAGDWQGTLKTPKGRVRTPGEFRIYLHEPRNVVVISNG